MHVPSARDLEPLFCSHLSLFVYSTSPFQLNFQMMRVFDHCLTISCEKSWISSQLMIMSGPVCRVYNELNTMWKEKRTCSDVLSSVSYNHLIYEILCL